MENSKWIWINNNSFDKNMYAEFYDNFTYNGKSAKIKISADSNYALYINGAFVNSGQYPDFPHYKVYDELDINSFCRIGENHIGIIVWYYGVANMSYYPGKAALKYSLYSDEELVSKSDEYTLSRLSIAYENGSDRLVTSQLGFSFHYDLTKEDKWLSGELTGFTTSAVVEQNLPEYFRPIDKYVIKNRILAEIIKNENNTNFVIDLGSETVGLLTFKIHSSQKQKITIAYGEYLENGAVHYEFYGNRNFTVNVTLKEGENEYFNPFRRFGLRYFEVFAEYPIEIEYLTVCPTEYPLKRKDNKLSNPLRKEIFNVSVRTLELCMHDHFEDCCWREQGLYGLDSRFEMLYSYYAFEDFRFARSNLLLMSKAQKREDRLMPICCPSGDGLSIPTYALYYIIASYEYFQYSKDKNLLVEIYDRLKEYLDAFINRLEDGLLKNWQRSSGVWNFYDWATGFDGYAEEKEGFDGVANCLLILALDSMHNINEILGKKDNYITIADGIRKAMYKLFDSNLGLFNISTHDDRKSELVNALAILSGVVNDEQARCIAEKLSDNSFELISVSLALRAIKYDALIKVDKNKYKDFILEEIDLAFEKMLNSGATSFWETEEGSANCGSLCQGWSALPVYYYSILEK